MKLFLTFILVTLACISVRPAVAQNNNTDCLRACIQNQGGFGFPLDCCGCCPEGENCFGNIIQPLCCESAWCGCISNRAFCAGSIFNSTEPVAPFGVCYEPSPSMSVCCYAPSPNVWKICPQNTTCCTGSNAITCCSGNEECTTDQTTGGPKCVPKSEPQLQRCGNRVYDPRTHRCINGILCGAEDGVCRGNVCYNPRDATCYPQLCAGALQGNATNDVLCGRGLIPCGRTCINPSGYFCSNGRIRQKPARGVSCGSSFCTGNQQCCSSRQADFPFNQCYDPLVESCAHDPRGFGALATRVCPLSPSGKAQGACLLLPSSNLECFDIDEEFCCQGSAPGGTAASILDLSERDRCTRNNPCLSPSTL